MTGSRRIPWSRILAEGAVIVVSILLAFGIDAWWDRQKDREAESTAILGLSSDLEASAVGLDETINFHRSFVEHLHALEHMSEVELASLQPDELGPYLFALGGKWTFDPQQGTLDALMASGGLSILRDTSLRDALMTWTARVDDLAEEADESRTATSELNRVLGEYGGPWVFRWTSPLATSLDLDEAVTQFQEPNLPVIAREDGIRARMRSKRMLSIVYLAELIPLREHLSELQEKLAAYSS